jgi:hypothetical protein
MILRGHTILDIRNWQSVDEKVLGLQIAVLTMRVLQGLSVVLYRAEAWDSFQVLEAVSRGGS